MSKFFTWIFILSIAALGWLVTRPATIQAPETQSIAQTSPRATREHPAATLEPSATIGYQATAAEAQSAASTAQANADAANRLLVEATAQHEANLQQQTGWTAEANRQQLMFLEWTATAGLTAIPATQTQMVQAQTQQAIFVVQLAQTVEAPTNIVMLAQAQSQANFEPINNVAYAFGLFAIAFFIICLGIWLLRRAWRAPEIVTEPEDHFGTVVSVKTEAAGYTSMSRMVIPCTPAQLQELAEGLLQHGKTLAINSWEGKMSEFFTRPSFMAMRNFLQSNALARSAGGGVLILTAEGESFLRAWLEQGSAPPPYKFQPEINAWIGDPAHMSDDHGQKQAVGEGRLAENA